MKVKVWAAICPKDRAVWGLSTVGEHPARERAFEKSRRLARENGESSEEGTDEDRAWADALPVVLVELDGDEPVVVDALSILADGAGAVRVRRWLAEAAGQLTISDPEVIP